MRLPRDLSADDLIKLLAPYGYNKTRQTGSHIRLTLQSNDNEHHITIPNHQPIKIGTLNSILKDIASHLKKDPKQLIKELFIN